MSRNGCFHRSDLCIFIAYYLFKNFPRWYINSICIMKTMLFICALLVIEFILIIYNYILLMWFSFQTEMNFSILFSTSLLHQRTNHLGVVWNNKYLWYEWYCFKSNTFYYCVVLNARIQFCSDATSWRLSLPIISKNTYVWKFFFWWWTYIVDYYCLEVSYNLR